MNLVEWIYLSQGKAALVDSEDYEWLNQWVWSLHSIGYAYRRDYSTGKSIFMHRLINKTPIGMHTDHINHIRLDNRKRNLRTVTQAENNANSSGNRFKKVYVDLPVRVTFDKKRGKYIGRRYKEKNGKRFGTLREAIKYSKEIL